eukprot:gene29881-36077_t
MLQCIASFVAQELAYMDLPKLPAIKSSVTGYIKHERFSREHNEVVNSMNNDKRKTHKVPESFKPSSEKMVVEEVNWESKPRRQAAIAAASEVSKTLQRPRNGFSKQSAPEKEPGTPLPNKKATASSSVPTKAKPILAQPNKFPPSGPVDSDIALSKRRGRKRKLQMEDDIAATLPAEASLSTQPSQPTSRIDREMDFLRSMATKVFKDFQHLVLLTKTHFPHCWTHRLRILECILLNHLINGVLISSWNDSLHDVVVLFASQDEIAAVLRQVILDDNVHQFIYILYMLNKLMHVRQSTSDLYSRSEGRELVKQLLGGEERLAELDEFLQRHSSKPWTLAAWKTIQPFYLASQGETTCVQALLLRAWKPLAIDRTPQRTSVLLKGKLLCSTLFKEYDLRNLIVALINHHVARQPPAGSTSSQPLIQQQLDLGQQQHSGHVEDKPLEIGQMHSIGKSGSATSLLSLSSVASFSSSDQIMEMPQDTCLKEDDHDQQQLFLDYAVDFTVSEHCGVHNGKSDGAVQMVDLTLEDNGDIMFDEKNWSPQLSAGTEREEELDFEEEVVLRSVGCTSSRDTLDQHFRSRSELEVDKAEDLLSNSISEASTREPPDESVDKGATDG